MFKKLLFLVLFSVLFTQEQSITNLTVGQLTDGSGLIEVTYDLIDEAGTFASFNVEIQVSIDGAEFETYSGSQVSGDVGENVIPGFGNTIYIQAPDETYSTNVVVKVIATAYTVTSELPFTMITISSVEGVSSYQDESISYSYEIMQNEMTNAELVTFLETYDFQLDADGSPTYNCSEYTEYYNTSTDYQTTVGCMDDNALNYNPSATYDDGSYCIYESNVGCTDYNAYNYNEGTQYDDCSCYGGNGNFHIESSDSTECDWETICELVNDEGIMVCEVIEHPFIFSFTQIGGNSMLFYLQNSGNIQEQTLIYEGCIDSDALNFADELANILTHDIFQNCVEFENDNCVYDCDESYLNIDDGEGENDYGTVNIEEFSTQAISFEGSSFIIESGLGTQPAIFNYENCVDGVIVGLLLDYYGLRIPTGGEWTKAAREDNTRCWPWLESDCDAAAESYCNSIFTCMTEEEFDACDDSVGELLNECQDNCNDSGSFGSGCSDITVQMECEMQVDCTWNGGIGYCLDACDQCMMDNGMACGGNPCSGSCPCCADCSGGGSGDDMMDCMQDCQELYGDPWEYCEGEDVNDCEWCMQNTNDCEETQTYNLVEFLDESSYEDDDGDGVFTSDYDYYGLFANIYSNKFYYSHDTDNDDDVAQNIEVTDIAQYPDGISPFGLYDMIGNAPEIVKYNNNLWLVGLNPKQDNIGSFCANDGTLFNEDNGNAHATGLSINAGYYYNLYGLRLARTTQ